MLSTFINNRRKQLNLSIEDLSALSGVPKNTVNKITAGITENPTLSTVEALCKALKCSIDDAVKHEFEPTAISPHQQRLLDCYERLDYFGRKAVDELISTEYSRCTAAVENEQPKIKLKISNYRVSAGCGCQLGEGDNWEEREIPDTPEARKADFALIINGNSMYPVFRDNDIILVQRQDDVEIGQIGIFILNGDGYIKKKGVNCLISINEEYDNIPINEYDDYRCVGKVIGRI